MLFIMKIFHNKVIRYAYLGWFVIALFFFYQYILRVAPGIMIEDIRNTYVITAEQFASLGALYLLAYAVLQIPLGIIVDKIGVKKMCLYSIAILNIGAVMMTHTDQFWIAQLSRFIMGIGSASAFMCTLKFIADHIPPGNRGFLMGATLTIGIGGAILFGRMMKFLDQFFNWNQIMDLITICGGIVFLLILFVVKNNKNDKGTNLNKQTLEQNLHQITKIIYTPRILIYSILAVGLYTPLSALADLWGAAFIKQKFGVEKNQASHLIMTLYIGLTLGSLILPWLSERYNILNKTIMLASFGLLISFSLLMYLPTFSHLNLIITLFIIGFFGGAEMMCFTGALVNSHQYNSGHIIGVVNTLNMLGGALVQQLVGVFLDKQWGGSTNAFGVRQYSTHNFENALSVLTILIAICCGCSLILFAIKNRSNKY